MCGRLWVWLYLGGFSLGTRNPFFDRQDRGTHKHGQKAEKKVAKRLGGKVRAGSGSVEGYKGDVELPDYLVENKTTINKSLSIKQDWLVKISVEAREAGRVPALAIQFVDSQGNSTRFGRWVMIPEENFKEITE